MRCPSESTENLTSWLKVFISSSVYMTIDPGTSSVVASSSCSVELLLDIFWAVFTGFSRFLVVVCERSFFYASPRICSSFQNREEPMAYFEKRFCSFLALQKVTNLFGFLSRCFFGFARQELSFGFLPSSLPFCFFLQYVFSYFWVWGVSSNFLKI